MRILCFGYGYVGSQFLHAITASERLATIRNATQASGGPLHGITPVFWDATKPLATETLSSITHILVTIPPQDNGDMVLKHHMQALIQMQSLEWIGYLSSTSVYGNHDGQWVDEGAACHPTSATGQARLEAETAWLKLHTQYGLPVHIFRLSGIYGPKRNTLVSLTEGKINQRISAPNHVFSRIHVADIIQVLKASISHPHPGAIYNLGDDFPASSADVIDYACKLLGREPPPLLPLAGAEISDRMREFYQDAKRVKNRRIKNDLGVKLLYPTYHEGLDALSQPGASGAKA